MEDKSNHINQKNADAPAPESPPVQQNEQMVERKQSTEGKGIGINEYKKKGMERLSGDKNMVQTPIMIMTEDGWQPVMVKRKRIFY